jgi:MFS family permease
VRRSPLNAVFVTVTIDLLGFGLILPLLPLYAKTYAASDWVVGPLFACYSLAQLLTAPAWGRLSDRIGRRPVLLVGLAGTLASYVLFAFVDVVTSPIALLFASRTLAGAFGGTITTAYAYIADVTPEGERARGMALIGAAFGIGFTIGPLVGGLGDHHLGRAGPGALAAGFAALSLLYCWKRLPEPERHRPSERAASWRVSAWGRTLGTEGVPLLLALGLLATGVYAIFESTLALLARARWGGWTPRSNGFLFAYLGLWLTVLQGVLVRRLLPRLGERPLVLLGLVALAVGVLATGYAPTLLLLALASPLAVAGYAMVTPSLTSLLSRRTDPSLQGEVLGVNQSVQSVARILGPLGGASLLALAPEAPYLAGAAILLGTLALARAVR